MNVTVVTMTTTKKKQFVFVFSLYIQIMLRKQQWCLLLIIVVDPVINDIIPIYFDEFDNFLMDLPNCWKCFKKAFIVVSML